MAKDLQTIEGPFVQIRLFRVVSVSNRRETKLFLGWPMDNEQNG